MPLRPWFARATGDRSAHFWTFLVCESAAFGIPVIDLMLPADVDLLPLNAIPVLIGSRLLPIPAARMLAGSAMLAQITKGFLDHSSAITVLISISTVLVVSLLARPSYERPAGMVAAHDRPGGAVGSGLINRLSRREREIVGLTLDGYTAPRIASSLFISRRTVETHLANAYRKMGIGSKMELVRRRREVTGAAQDPLPMSPTVIWRDLTRRLVRSGARLS